MLTEEQLYSLGWARFYRKRGFNPLPSRMDEKRPFMKYAHLWETLAPDEWFTEEGWPETCNIQVVCGTAWRLFVVDLDGARAKAVWDRWCAGRPRIRTWVSHRDGGDSLHYWFRIPQWHREPVRKCFVWRGDGEHEAVEILGDRSLVVAPPSRHVKTGGMYRFVRGCSPAEMGLPSFAPKWVLDLEPVVPERAAHEAVPPRPKVMSRAANPESFIDRDELLARLPDKAEIAREWGLRIAGSPSPSGWVPCKGIDREDHRPSAAIHREFGIFVDRGTGESYSFFDLMVAMGRAVDFEDARNRLMERI